MITDDTLELLDIAINGIWEHANSHWNFDNRYLGQMLENRSGVINYHTLQALIPIGKWCYTAA